MKKQTHEHMRAIGRAGGKKTAERAGHMASIAVKGGASTRAKYGPEYYAELGRKSAAARAARSAGNDASPEGIARVGTIETPGVETRAELTTTPAAHTRAETAASPKVIARAVEQTSPTVIARAETEAKPEATTRAESTAPTVT